MNVRVALSYVEDRFIFGMGLDAIEGSQQSVVVFRDKRTDFFSLCVEFAQAQITIDEVKL